MTLRKLLIILLSISFILILTRSKIIYETALYVASNIDLNWKCVGLITIAIVLQIIGHVIRSKKAKLLFSPIKRSSIATQFRAFGVGTLFNNLLPLRLGELVRTAIISQKLNISYLYTFTLIIFERSIDLLIICVLAATSVSIMFGYIPFSVLPILSALACIALLILVGILLIKRLPSWLLSFFYHISIILNNKLKILLQFKIWSVSFGLNKTLQKKYLIPYFGLTLSMWIFYFLSAASIALSLGVGGFKPIILSAISPYFGVSAPAGPAGLGTYSSAVGNLMQLVLPHSTITIFNIVTWSVLLIPISIIGVFLLQKTKEPIWTSRHAGSSDASLENKITRSEDISRELKFFLDSFFRGNKLSKIVHTLELEGEFNLVRYFKGGSDAITILVLKNGRRVVKKIIPIEFKSRLEAQYKWLKKYGGGDIIKALDQQTANDYYSIDLSYDATNIPLLEYIHNVSLTEAKAIIRQAWNDLNTNVYGTIQDPIYDPKSIKDYINKHIFNCIDIASQSDPTILEAMKPKKIIINGKEYDNLKQVIKKIRANKKAWVDICTFRRCDAVHGDMIIDNLLYSKKTGRVIIIDPAPDGNIVEGPVFDFGKAAQSFYCGYEFLLRDESAVTYNDGAIFFIDSKSFRFSEISSYMLDVLAKKYLTESEQRAILFHAGTLYLRRLKHQVNYTPKNVLKFYAVGVRTLNEFFDQYQ